MSATINVYSLPQVVNLVLGGSTGAGMMNYPVNNSDFKVTKGVTNEILFFVRDVDRQIVTFDNPPQAIISDMSSQTVLVNRAMTLYNANSSIYMLSLSPSDVEDWPLGYVRYSILDNRDDGSQVLLYTDRGYGPYSNIQVLEGPFPQPPEATVINSSDMIIVDGSFQSGPLPGAAAVGNISGLMQATFQLCDYIGVIVIQGSLDNQPSPNDTDWFVIENVVLTEPTSGQTYVSFTGNYLWVRFRIQVFNNVSGNYAANNGAGFENQPNNNAITTFNSITYRND